MQRQDFSSLATPELLNVGQGSWYHNEYDGRQYEVYTRSTIRSEPRCPCMMLHSCALFPLGFAYLSHMNLLADQHQFLVVYPHALDPKQLYIGVCWNWFLAVNQHRGSGEPFSLAGIVQAVLQNTSRWTIDPQRMYLAGVSAGACVAVNLGVTYPDLFAAIGVHSGAKYQARSLSLPLKQPAAAGEAVQAQAAVETLRDQQVLFREEFFSVISPGPDPIEQGEKAFQAMGPFARVMPTIVFHGTADLIADPINGDQVTQQWLYTNQLASHGAFTATFEHPSSATISPAGPQGEKPYTVFMIVSNYRAKVGEEDAIMALHEDWQRSQGFKAKAYLSWKLLRKVDALHEFIAIAYFSSEELARAAESDLEQDAWYSRLMSLIEEGPIHTGCISEWQLR
jgi:poly(hydroxyalkanoate) depolymerase family esterase